MQPPVHPAVIAKMDSYSWKRNLFPTFYRPIGLKDARGSQHAESLIPNKLMPTKESTSAVVSQQTPEDADGNGNVYLNGFTHGILMLKCDYKYKFVCCRGILLHCFGWSCSSCPSGGYAYHLSQETKAQIN